MWRAAHGSDIHLHEIPNYKYDISTALIWLKAKCVLEANNVTDQLSVKKKRAQPSLNMEEVTGSKVS